MVFPETTGDDQPTPGNADRHSTLSLLLQVSGGRASAATPVASGPRNCVHCADNTLMANRSGNARVVNVRRVIRAMLYPEGSQPAPPS